MSGLLLGVLVLGIVGTTADLLLLAHYEDTAQLIPLGLLAVALLIVAWHTMRPGGRSRRALQMTMGLFVVAGIAGVGLHFAGSAEFQREIDPSLGWRQMALKAVRAKAPPTLAPGAMIMLGLVGLIYTLNPRTES